MQLKKKNTILIFGVSSFVGSSLAEFFKTEYKVVGTYYGTRVSIPGVMTVKCDILAKEEVQLVIYAFKPDVTIYAVGLSSLTICDEEPDLADALNTAGLINVTEYCQRYKSQICYISSGYVFSGEDRIFMEMDIPDSNTVYGKTQAASEFYIQKTSLNYVIFRCCPLYGRSLNPNRQTWFEGIQNYLKQGNTVSLDARAVNGYLDIYYLGMLINICLEKEVTNRLFQVSSSDFMSSYEFGLQYAEVFNENKAFINRTAYPVPEIGNSGKASTASCFKMDVKNIEGYLHVEMPSIRESLEFTLRRLNGSHDKEAKNEGIKFI